ncbi:MAG: hypothetical protein H7249_13390 [Chitinophagaceae bacterium]|nr:hypothetical protein [Oligoflexus sp.]
MPRFSPAKLMSLIPFLLGSLLFVGLSYEASALPFATGRAGGGYVYLPGYKGAKGSSTQTLSGSGRFGYLLDESRFYFALDANAYRVYKNKTLMANQDGNSGLLIVGYELETQSFWMGAGAGEIRIYDRTDYTVTGKKKSNHYYTNEQAIGYNYQLYRADFARVECGASLSRIVPDSDWRTKTKVGSINTLQIDIGFKLFNW